MSLTRQSRLLARPDGDIWIRTYAVRFPSGFDGEDHDHDWHQLSYASEGALRVATADSAWVAPPHRAVWIPARIRHREEFRSRGTMRSLYLASCICRNQPRHCAVINVPPLLRELILHAAQLGALDARVPAQKRLAEVIADQLTLLSPEERQRLPMPRDPRALSLARRLMDDPDCDASLTTLAAKAGASARTIQRLFLNETQLSFARWRQRMRLLAAVERLAAGSSVTNAALDVGYHSVSAFVSSFRKEFGASPGRLGRKG